MNKTINLDASAKANIFGKTNKLLAYLGKKLGIKLTIGSQQLHLTSDSPEKLKRAESFLNDLINTSRKTKVTKQIIDQLYDGMISLHINTDIAESVVLHNFVSSIVAKTEGQRKYINTILSNEMTFCLGPAGTGKTYLAVASAISLFKEGKYERIILVRPAVEAGEKIGFLPGSLDEKLAPYMTPITDALNDMMKPEMIKKYMENKVIELAPIGFMRGRTFSNCVVIMDEAQNSTKEQMLMFLTRMGRNCKMIITGDTSQIDIDLKKSASGLRDAVDRLKTVKNIGFIELELTDIVRNPLVEEVIKAYNRSV